MIWSSLWTRWSCYALPTRFSPHAASLFPHPIRYPSKPPFRSRASTSPKSRVSTNHPKISAAVKFQTANCDFMEQDYEGCSPVWVWVKAVPLRLRCWRRAEFVEFATSWLGCSWWTSPPQPIGEGCWLSAENGATSDRTFLPDVSKEPMPLKRIPPWRRSCFALRGSSNRSLLFPSCCSPVRIGVSPQ